MDRTPPGYLTEFFLTENWRRVLQVLKTSRDRTHSWFTYDHLVQACQSRRANEKIILQLMPFYGTKLTEAQIQNLLGQLMTKSYWTALDAVLKKVSKENGRTEYNRVLSYLVEKASSDAQDRDIAAHVIPYCLHSPSTRTILVKNTMKIIDRKLWISLGVILKENTSRNFLSPDRIRRIVNNAVTHATEKELNEYIMPTVLEHHCSDYSILAVMANGVRDRELWRSTGIILHKMRSREDLYDSRFIWQMVDIAACRAAGWELTDFILPNVSLSKRDRIVSKMTDRRLWEDVVKALQYTVSDNVFQKLVSRVSSSTETDSTLADFIQSVPQWHVFRVLLQHDAARRFTALPQRLRDLCSQRAHAQFTQNLCELVLAVVEWIASDSQTSGNCIKSPTDQATSPEEFNKMVQEVFDVVKLELFSNEFGSRFKDLQIHYQRTGQNEDPNILSEMNTFSIFMTRFASFRREFTREDDALLVVLACVPLFVTVQNLALRQLLKLKRWGVIKHASLLAVWEDVRRELFEGAVLQKRWSVVKMWADHSLYDDQRQWGMSYAWRHHQWQVMLLLADHGLAETERQRVLLRLARHADWNTLLAAFQNGLEVTELKELLLSKDYNSDDDLKRTQQLAGLEQSLLRCNNGLLFSRALESRQWGAVLLYLKNKNSKVESMGLQDMKELTEQQPHPHCLPGDAGMPDGENEDFQWKFQNEIRHALDTAIDVEAWPVVRSIARNLSSVAQRDALFIKMLQRGQWDVCRALLEGGVSVAVCRQAVPTLMRHGQWVLLCRVLEHDVGDSLRHQVLAKAITRRQRSLVRHCLCTMTPYVATTATDTTFSAPTSAAEGAAAEKDLKRWDVVFADNCFGETGICSAGDKGTSLLGLAMKNDWVAVKDQVSSGSCKAQKEISSVLKLAADAHQWGVVKLLIQFFGDVSFSEGSQTDVTQRSHSSDDETKTCLAVLIEEGQAELIDTALLWQQTTHGAVTNDGETALHAACLAGRRHDLYYLIARGCDPLAVNCVGQTVLLYATMCERPQWMVAECVKLGMAVHQAVITQRWNDVRRLPQRMTYGQLNFVSPMEVAIARRHLGVVKMLWESEASSRAEVETLYRYITSSACQGPYKDAEGLQEYLQRAAFSPRSLASSCRLVVAKCLDVRGKRHKRVLQLPLPKSLKDYVMFADLVLGR